jgi:hypothetical protein
LTRTTSDLDLWRRPKALSGRAARRVERSSRGRPDRDRLRRRGDGWESRGGGSAPGAGPSHSTGSYGGDRPRQGGQVPRQHHASPRRPKGPPGDALGGALRSAVLRSALRPSNRCGVRGALRRDREGGHRQALP